MVDRNEISLIGEALYGSSWKSALAKALGVDRTTISRYSNGSLKTNPALYNKLMSLINQKKIELSNAEYQLSLLVNTHINRAIVLETRDFSIRIINIDIIKIGNINLDDVRITPKNRGFVIKSIKVYLKINDPNTIILEVNHLSKNSREQLISKSPRFILNKFISESEVIDICLRK